MGIHDKTRQPHWPLGIHEPMDPAGLGLSVRSATLSGATGGNAAASIALAVATASLDAATGGNAAPSVALSVNSATLTVT